jgi:hypothetical protein
MPPVSRTEFRSLVRGLPTDALARFVAAVWAARGYETDVHGDGVVVATDPETGAAERLAVRTAGRRLLPGSARDRDPAPEVDCLVVADVDPRAVPGVRVIGADELREVLLYAADREAAAAAFRSRFDRPLVTGPAPPPVDDPTHGDAGDRGANGRAARDPAEDGGGQVTRAGRDPVARLRRRVAAADRNRTAAVSILVVLVVAGAVAGAGLPESVLPDGEAGATAPDVGDRTTQTTAVESDTTTGTAGDPDGASDGGRSFGSPPDDVESVAGPSADQRAAVFPPGLSEDGIVDYTRLAAAHARTLRNVSYRVVFTRREFAEDVPVSVQREVAVVEGPSTYRNRITVAGSPDEDARIVSDDERYANGTATVVRRPAVDGGPVVITPPPGDGDDPFLDRAERYLRYFLSVRESRVAGRFVRDGRTYYWVTFVGDPWPAVENTTGSALVDDRGVVHEVRRRYREPSRPAFSVVVTVEYTHLGTATVTPPGWAPTPQSGPGEATIGNATASPTTDSETADTTTDDGAA